MRGVSGCVNELLADYERSTGRPPADAVRLDLDRVETTNLWTYR
ncbi:hypothetical protein ABWI13_30895 [Streptomyces koyangensis]